jgi:hypothetical protein
MVIAFGSYYSPCDIYIPKLKRIPMHCSLDPITLDTTYLDDKYVLFAQIGSSEYAVSEFDEGRNGGK